jgi:hypothetical protein
MVCVVLLKTNMIKLNLGSGRDAGMLDGFVNLDKDNGWYWEDKFKYADNSIDAITESHSLMYVRDRDLPGIVSELYRILKVGGVVRITESERLDPNSPEYGIIYDRSRDISSFRNICRLLSYGELDIAKNTTGFEKYKKLFTEAGFEVFKIDADETYYSDKSLIQCLHGKEPNVFFLEALKKTVS